jgi:cytosine deaminase
MIDLLLRNTSRGDLGVDDGRLVPPGPARAERDLGGRLVTPPLVEPHIHLDAVLTVGQPRPNVSGSLFEGIAIWAQRVQDLTVEDVKDRVRQVLRWQLACGVQHVRSHVDVCDPSLRALRALVEVREEARGIVDLQLVAFPQQGILGFDGGADLMRKAVGAGADVVGAIPHYELTREDGVESVKFAMALADEHGLRVDIHCDETDDDHSRFVEVMAAETIRRGMSGRVTASLVQRRVRVAADHQHRPGRPAHGDESAGQRGAAGPLRHRSDPAWPHPGEAAARGRRERRHRTRLRDGPLVPPGLR